MAQTIRPVPAVKRAIEILGVLARSSEPQTLSQIARSASVIPSSCLHILRELAAGRLVRFDEERKVYSLGWGVLDLARALRAPDAFADLVQPRITQIALKHHAVASASVFDGRGHIVVVASTHGSDQAPIHLPVGLRVPCLSSATGRVLVAFNEYSDEQLRRAFAELIWQRPLTFRRWKQEIAQVRVDGYAIDEGQYRRGITVVAAPIFHGDRMDRFIGASALSEQVGGKALRELASDVKRASEAIGREISGPDLL